MIPAPNRAAWLNAIGRHSAPKEIRRIAGIRFEFHGGTGAALENKWKNISPPLDTPFVLQENE
jgi:hypothetical protein